MDLGTARGKVRVDADTKGLDKAERNLKLFDKALQVVGRAAQSFERGLNGLERELNQASADMREADKAAGDLSGNIDRADAATLVWTKDLKLFHERLKGVHATAEKLGPSLLQVAKVGSEFRKTNGGITGFAQAVTRAGAVGTVLQMLTSRFYGVGAAMATLPAGAQRIIQLSNSFRLLTFGVGLLTAAAVKTGIFGRAYESVFRKVVKHSELGTKAFMKLENGLKPFGPAIQKAVRYVGDLNEAVDKIPKGAVQALVGFAVMSNGIRGLAARFAFITQMSGKMAAIVGGAFATLPAAIELGAVALRGFSNTLALVLDGVKQLAGGFLAIPGGITMMITAIGTLKVLFGGLKKAFEDVFKAKDATEMAAAIDALPEHLKPLGKVLGDIIPKWKAISTEMQKTFVIGADAQLKALSENYLPAVRQGVLPLVNAFRQVKDEIVAFAAQGESISFIKNAFALTTQTIMNLKPAIAPVLAGFRDIATVGMQFIEELSVGAGGLTKQFAAWAAVNRENGNLMRWMKDAVAGVKDLWNGLKDAGKALWTLLTLFQTDTGDNALDRFAAAMKKFNDAVQKSAAEGILKRIGDAVKQIGTDKLKQLWDVMRSLGDALKQVIPFVVNLSKSFGDVFYPALKLTLELIEQFTEVLNQVGGARILGTILGLVAAFKTLSLVLGPVRNAIQIVWGALKLFDGAETLILGAAGALEKFGPAGKKASDAILGIGDTLKTALGAAGIAAAVAAAFYEFYQAGAEQIDNMKAKVGELDQFTDTMGQKIASQIIDEGTLKNSVKIFADNIEQMRTKMQDAADAAPGIAGSMVDSIRAASEAHPNSRARVALPAPDHTKEFEDLKNTAEAAKKADDAIDKLGMTTDQLNDKVTGTRAGFDAFIGTLKASGEGGEIAAGHFEKLRTEWEALQRAGEGGVQIAHGIDQIADSAGDAASKLDGLKSALEGAGLLQTSQLDAAFAYAQSIRDIADASQDAVDKSQPLNDILNATGDGLNVNSVNAQNLHNALKTLEQGYLDTVAQGGDARAEWEKQQPALQKLADQFNLPLDKVQQLAAAEGGLPDQIALLLTVEGADEVQQDVVASILKAQSTAKGQPVVVPIEGDPAQVKTMLEGLLGPGAVLSSTDTTITLNPNIDDAKLAAAVAALNKAGISVPGHPAAAPATVNVQPNVVADRRGKGPTPAPTAEPPTQGTPIQAGAAGPPKPEVAVSTGDQASLDQAKSTIGDIKKAVDELNGEKIKIEVDAEALNNLTKSVDQIYTDLAQKDLKLKVTLDGMDQFQQGMNVIQTSISASVIDWNNYRTAVVRVFQDIVSAFNTAMDQLTAKMAQAGANNVAAGTKFGNDFAQGIRNSIAEISAAADAAAAAAADRMPHSPAKKGPLSGRGWSGYAGQAFANDFAQGIQDATAAAADASAGLANAATAGMAGRNDSFQGFLGGLSRVLDIISSAIGVVQSTFDNISKGFQTVSDIIKGPEKKETPHEGTGAAPGPGGPSNRPAAGGFPSDKDILSRVPAGQYSQKSSADLTKGLGDCSSAVEDLVNIIDKKPTGGRQMSTGNAAQWLTAHGFQKGTGGPGDFRVAFNVNHMQATLPGGTPFNWGSNAAAARRGIGGTGADDPALTQKYFRAGLNGDQAKQFADEVSSSDLSVYDAANTDATNATTTELSDNDKKIIGELRTNNTSLDDALKANESPNKTDKDQQTALDAIQQEIDKQGGVNGDQNKEQVTALNDLKNSIAPEGPTSQLDAAAKTLGSITDIASGAMNIAQDVIGVFKTGIETIGKVKESMDLLVRGVENTEQLNTFIDTFQKFIELGAKVAQTVSDVTGMISGMAGQADFGATAAISAISGLISGVLTTINAGIDVAQEAWHIFGSYFGQFLGFLAGAGDQLEGDVKFLLDTNDKTLKAYSTTNPQDKASHPYGGAGEFLGGDKGPQPQIGQITVFGGPNQDPRDTTRNMMFAVKTATMGATYAK